MSLLRYTGQQPTSFMAYPYLGEVAPGEFEARDADAEVLLRRADVEDAAADPADTSDAPAEVEPAAPSKRKTTASKTSDATPAPADTVPTTSA